MAEKSFPFNSVSKDRIYKAEDFAEYFAQLIGTGIIYKTAEALKIKADSGMNVILQSGGAFVKGRGYINTNDLSFTIETADGVLNRVDRVVISCNYSTRAITAKIKKGAYSAQPTAPALQRDGDVYELAIADIYIGKGVTTISQAVITDQRLNTELCGIVTGVIEQADTTEIFQQFTTYLEQFKTTYIADIGDWTQAQENSFTVWSTQQQTAFTEWVNTIKNILDETTAGNLQNEIEELQSTAAALETDKAEKVLLDKEEAEATAKGFTLEIHSGALCVKRVR